MWCSGGVDPLIRNIALDGSLWLASRLCFCMTNTFYVRRTLTSLNTE